MTLPAASIKALAVDAETASEGASRRRGGAAVVWYRLLARMTWRGRIAALVVLLAFVFAVSRVMDAATASPDTGEARATADAFLRAAAAGNGAPSLCQGAASDPFTLRVATGTLRLPHTADAGGETTFAGSTEHDLLYAVRGVAGVRGIDVDVRRGPTGWCVSGVVPNPPGRY